MKVMLLLSLLTCLSCDERFPIADGPTVTYEVVDGWDEEELVSIELGMRQWRRVCYDVGRLDDVDGDIHVKIERSTDLTQLGHAWVEESRFEVHPSIDGDLLVGTVAHEMGHVILGFSGHLPDGIGLMSRNYDGQWWLGDADVGLACGTKKMCEICE